MTREMQILAEFAARALQVDVYGAHGVQKTFEALRPDGGEDALKHRTWPIMGKFSMADVKSVLALLKKEGF